MDLVVVFKILVLFTTIQRIGELFLAKSNERYLMAEGATLIRETNYFYMVMLHTSWLVYLNYIAFFERLSFNTTVFAIGTLLFVLGQTLRLTAIFTLGKRWSTRIIILPNCDAVRAGIFKYFRHPNYLGVVIELFALPMAAGLWQAAIFFSIVNFVILYFRICLEEHHLNLFNNYKRIYGLK